MKTMQKLGCTVALAGLLAAGSAQAAIIDNSTPIPDSVVLLNFNGSGLDWVYAGPIGPGEWGPGWIEDASYRAAEGWRAATPAEWANHPDWDDFIVPGYSVSPNAGHTDHSSYLFASEYWGDFYHVDINDFANGSVTDGVNNPGVLGWVPETIYVRVSAVPEPETYAMLLAGLGLLGFSVRRKQNV